MARGFLMDSWMSPQEHLNELVMMSLASAVKASEWFLKFTGGYTLELIEVRVKHLENVEVFIGFSVDEDKNPILLVEPRQVKRSFWRWLFS
jgi:hypothetical protein